MVNNYPEYAAGVNYKKTDSNDVTHFYSAQVVADPSDDTIESKLIKDGVVISEGGGGSSDLSLAKVTVINTVDSNPTGLLRASVIVDNVMTTALPMPASSTTVSDIVLYKGCSIFDPIDPSLVGSISISGAIELVELEGGNKVIYRVTGDCTITIA